MRQRHVEQLAVEHHALLEQQVGSAIPVLGDVELGVDQLDDRIGTAAPRQQLARRCKASRSFVRRRAPRRAFQRLERLRVIRVMLENGEKSG